MIASDYHLQYNLHTYGRELKSSSKGKGKKKPASGKNHKMKLSGFHCYISCSFELSD
jgi:hypothetical protein